MNTPWTKITHITLIFLISLFVSACGGGGAGDAGGDLQNNNNFSTATSRTLTSKDDAEEGADGSIWFSGSDLELISDPSHGGIQTVGLRFNLEVPQGVTITNSYIQFTTNETNETKTQLTIHAEDTDNASQFTNVAYDLSTRPLTSSIVTWQPDGWLTIGESGPDQRTTDISALVQGIVNRGNWSSSNHIAFIISGTGQRIAATFDTSPDLAPQLVVEFEGDAVSPNIPPIANAGLDTAALEQSQILLSGSGSDSDGNISTYSWTQSSGPSALLSGTNTANLTVSTPSVTEATTLTFLLTVTDNNGGSDSDSVNVIVSPNNGTNYPPTLSGTPAINVIATNQYNFTPLANDANNDTLTFSIVNMPTWATFDTSTGTLSGIPSSTDTGTATNLIITVSDGTATDSIGPFSITVTNFVNSSPELFGTPTIATQEGQSYTFTVTGNDAENDSLSFSITGLPSWANFSDLGNGTATLSGTPNFNQAGIYNNIIISVSDGSNTTSLPPFTVTVSDTNRAPILSGSPNSTTVISEYYAFSPNYSDPDGDSLLFSIENIPTWASFDLNTGTLYGTPSVNDEGIFNGITISVSDGIATTSLDPFNIDVCAASCSDQPKILYTDIFSGPNSGGENNNGAYLSIFGKNFGINSGLGTTTKVYINGVEVADYKYLGASKGLPSIQQLSVQVGQVSSGIVQVEVDGISSNSDHSFTVQPGNIYYVSLSGSDATGIANEITQPYRTLQDANNNGVWNDKALPGDFIILRGGQWFDVGLDDRFLRLKSNTGTPPNGSLGTGPITIMGYPGEDVHIHSATRGAIHNRGNADEAKWIVISGLRIEGGDNSNVDAPINMQWGSDDWRVINNELFDWNAMDQDINGQRTEARAAGIAGNGNRVKILGNSIHGIGGGTKNHGIYLDFDGNPSSVDDIQVAWNHIYNHTGGNLIQLYGALGSLSNVSIHNNLLHDGTRYGINLGAGSDLNIHVWNNIIYNTAFAGLRMDCSNTENMLIYHNVFFNVDTANVTGAIRNDWEMQNASFEFKNNIVVPSPSSKGYIGTGSGWDAANFENNIWHGKGIPPSLDTNPVGSGTEVDPLFANTANNNFRLTLGSPGIDTAIPLSSITIDTDFDSMLRSEGTAPDVGAFEYIY